MHYFSIDLYFNMLYMYIAFKTLHKPYISERMFHLYFLLK